MIIYLDTNVILARWAPQEPHHGDAKRILQAVEVGKVQALTSILTLLEVASTTGRASQRFKEGEAPMSREEISGAFLRRVVNTRNLSLIPFGGDITLDIDDAGIKVPALLAVALEVAAKTGVNTLDSIHVASVYVASRIYGHRVEYLVTLDEDILRRRKEVEALTGVKVAAPIELSSERLEGSGGGAPCSHDSTPNPQ